ncbi:MULTISPECIES: 2OG-Fe(II) oxygenase [unclassified Cupriavidus]|uniref:2OG-Fe(II) oxygenase n=1 Tax=unclassified Cupriavidus TaxID=2640874 RepID=UPI0003F8D54B|nr:MULTISPECIES: 2OG-Fe(II) oxygenase [unclassified Cupriavidus]MBP0630789.1 2OG-Fe(II) oxygenase [Cupriavidus sp. AcVe19-1a]MBP0640097.1 2OG-Fe(II) oxygenase [Cupriavidus sp. AcVe19-6a]
MNATTTLLLPEDVVVAPVANLPPDLSRGIAHEPDDFIVTRPTDGAESFVVDADTAALLAQFRSPTTVVDAIANFCRKNELDPMRTLDDAFAVLADLVAAMMLVPAEAHLTEPVPRIHSEWQTYRYYEIYRRQFSEEECRSIVSLHAGYSMVASRIDYQSGDPVRDCHLFWVPRSERTEWIFSRLWEAAQRFNKAYQFELSPEMGMAQLTRYTPGQQYNWHMDLGSKDASVRKISIVLQLSANKDMEGGGTEIFYGDAIDNQLHADIGDVVVFPSFVMHRAAMITGGVRWTLVIWLTGPRPLR